MATNSADRVKFHSVYGTQRFKNNTIHEGDIELDGNLTVAGTQTITGAVSFAGNQTIGDAIGDSHTINGDLTQNGSTAILGVKKFQSFVGTLAGTNGAAVAYEDGDVLVELGTLDTSVPTGHVAATKFFIDKVVVGVTTAAATAVSGMIELSATSGTATNVECVSATEICGAGVDAFSTLDSAAQSEGGTEIDINLNATAGLFHVFAPNISAAIASKHLYLCATTALNADATAGRYTVMVEYTVY